MTLIKCPGCDRDVSSLAVACPHCGHPVQPTTIEATGKHWKQLTILAAVVLILGIVVAVGGRGGGLTNVGAWLIVLGVGLALYSKLGAWWHHG